MRRSLNFFTLLLILTSCDNSNKPGTSGISKIEFEQLLQKVAVGWNNGDARTAANCFSENAVYIEPPQQQLYIGREELFEFFGGEKGRAEPMHMSWHYLIFDELKQIGTGEYTFRYKGRITHGLVIVQIQKEKIARWREYQYRTKVEWDEFIGESSFIKIE